MDYDKLTELVIQINTKLDLFIGEFAKVSNGVGFPRCAERGATITDAQKRIEDLEENQKWLWRTVLGSIITALIAVGVKMLGK